MAGHIIVGAPHIAAAELLLGGRRDRRDGRVVPRIMPSLHTVLFNLVAVMKSR